MKPSLGYMSNIVSPSMSLRKEKQTKPIQVSFQYLDAVFQKYLFSDCLEITAAVVVPCGRSKNYPRLSIWSCFSFRWECRASFVFLATVFRSTCGYVAPRKSHHLKSFQTSTIKPSLVFYQFWMLNFQRIPKEYLV